MGILSIVFILVVWGIAGIKEGLTPPKPAIKDTTEHLNKIMSLPTVRARQDYLKKM